jgi:hypothetical protein
MKKKMLFSLKRNPIVFYRFFYRLFSWLLLTKTVVGQDTLCFRGQAGFAVILIEIGTSEVRYKRIENPNGPTYVTETAQLDYIRVRSAEREFFKNTYSQVIQKKSDQLEFSKGRFYYRGRTYPESKIQVLINQVNDQDKKRKLNEIHHSLRSARDAQRIFFAAGLPLALGGGMASLVMFDSFSGMRNQSVVLIPVAIVAGGLAALIQSKLKKDQRLAQMKALAEVYNTK